MLRGRSSQSLWIQVPEIAHFAAKMEKTGPQIASGKIIMSLIRLTRHPALTSRSISTSFIQVTGWLNRCQHAAVCRPASTADATVSA
jgi:hypothetical protein